MKLLLALVFLLNGCAAMLSGVGGGLQAQNQSRQTSCYTHCYAGNCTTTCN